MVSLTYFCEHKLASKRVSQPHGELLAVPDCELFVGQNRPTCVEIDVPLDLTCHQGLVCPGVGWVNVTHPVGLANVQTVDVVEVCLRTVNLQEIRFIAISLNNKAFKFITFALN